MLLTCKQPLIYLTIGSWWTSFLLQRRSTRVTKTKNLSDIGCERNQNTPVQDHKPLVALPPMPADLADKIEESLKDSPVQNDVSAEILKARTRKAYYWKRGSKNFVYTFCGLCFLQLVDLTILPEHGQVPNDLKTLSELQFLYELALHHNFSFFHVRGKPGCDNSSVRKIKKGRTQTNSTQT